METGLQVFFQSAHEGMSDLDTYKNEIDLCMRAEELGFDYLLSPEHHFTSYSMAPDPAQFLSYMAARTERIKLVTGAIILSWNDPLRVAEKVILLDYLANSRVVLGLGRGLARIEYETFGIDMGEARDRFDESARMILPALESGWIEGDGPHYPQARTQLRPGPVRSFKGRTVAVARSEESVLMAAELGAAMMMVVQKPIEQHMPSIEVYRRRYREVHGEDAPPPWLIDWVYVNEDEAEARKVAERYMSDYYKTVLHHYDYVGNHFGTTKGYESYAAGAAEVQAKGVDAAGAAYVGANTFGTPDQVIERIRHRRDVVGDYVALSSVSYSGLPYDMVHDSLSLLGKEVLPVVAAM
ncbi:MAG: LLM class flavin-dependent oxidoreductase [Pseudonocardiaceae bacterium]|nr:MAG: LLM class flavin-dependent oxidoreductase [Pseudonocardiaceae bacterium]